MRKILIVLILCVAASGVFALDVSLDGHISTFAFYPALESGIVMPSVGVGIDIGPVEFLGSFELMFQGERDSRGVGTFTERNTIFGMFFGAAPKVSAGEKLSFAFPLFMKIHIIGLGHKYSRTPPDDTFRRFVRGAFGFDAGARAYYALTDNWSMYSGFQVEMFAIHGRGRNATFGGRKTDGDIRNIYWFDTGSIDIGIKYTFKSKKSGEKDSDQGEAGEDAEAEESESQ